MPKVTIPTKCAKCGSERLRHEELSMMRKHCSTTFSGLFRFDVYICEECGYSELFFKERL